MKDPSSLEDGSQPANDTPSCPWIQDTGSTLTCREVRRCGDEDPGGCLEMPIDPEKKVVRERLECNMQLVHQTLSILDKNRLLYIYSPASPGLVCELLWSP